MPRLRFCCSFSLLPLLCLLASVSLAQQKTSEEPKIVTTVEVQPEKPDYSKEGAIFEKVATSFDFNADGTGTKTIEVAARVQSAAAVQQFGVITFPYASGNERIAVDYLRVCKPDGSVVETPASDAQDMPTDVTRAAPFYSDLKELQIPVKSLSPGDEIQYRIHFDIFKPEAEGQFWGSNSWITTNVVLDQTIQLSFPSNKYVLVLSPSQTPQISEQSGRKTYVWKSSQLKATGGDDKGTPDPDAMPSVAWTTFHSWQEVGDWWASLAKDRAAVTPEIQSKVQELLQGKTTDEEKMQAIYNFVSLQVRYIGVAFGVGRYQPHSAEEVLENQYGDCKDKDTLLQAMLKAAGFDAWPALIGSAHKLHPELPSPEQFDHVITVVPRGNSVIWLDSTPEITPWEMLIAPLRDKQALVMPTTGEPKLMRTPADSPFPFLTTYTAIAKLDSDGTLSGHISLTMRGDSEIVFRELYRATPRAQWQQLAQNISQNLGYAGTVSNLDVSRPDRTDQPFQTSWDYDRKEYADWANHRILPLMTVVDLPAAGDSGKPVDLPSKETETFHSEITLPAQYTAVLPQSVKYASPWATYETTYKLDGNKFITDRKVQILDSKVPADQAQKYKDFMDKVSTDAGQYVQLVAAGGPKPDTTPSNPDAVGLIQAAWAELNNHNPSAARTDLQNAEQLNPRERGLWAEYGALDMMENRLDDAQADLHKEIQYHPDNAQVYNMLAALEVRMKNTDAAIATLQDLLKVFPDDVSGEISLGSLLVLEKKYNDAATLLEGAAKKSPANKILDIQAGHADILAGKRDAGAALLHSALDGSDSPEILNDASYEMADGNLDLPAAEAGCKKALDILDKQTSAITLAGLTRDDIQHVQLLTATWDTMGWIYFREGKTDLAESYVRAAWFTSQPSEVGDHLGQIYEKEGRLQDAANTYALADAAGTLSPSPQGKEDVANREKALAARGFHAKFRDAGEELGKQRSVYLPRITKDFSSADFFVLLSPGKVEDVSFIKGDERLKSAADLLRKADFGAQFPQGSDARLARRGILACSGVTDQCQFTLLLPQSVSIN